MKFIYSYYVHEKGSFAEISENLTRYRSENNLDHRNNYVGRSN